MPGERLLGRWPRKCAVCGKDFFANDDWVFKDIRGKKQTKTWFCKRSCKQKWLEEHGEPKKGRKP